MLESERLRAAFVVRYVRIDRAFLGFAVFQKLLPFRPTPGSAAASSFSLSGLRKGLWSGIAAAVREVRRYHFRLWNGAQSRERGRRSVEQNGVESGDPLRGHLGRIRRVGEPQRLAAKVPHHRVAVPVAAALFRGVEKAHGSDRSGSQYSAKMN